MSRTTSLFVFLFALALSQVYGDSMKLGVRIDGDQMIERLHLRSVIPGPGEYIAAFDKMYTMQGQRGATISQVVIDDRSPMPCATVTPINGGPGSTFVVLHVVGPDRCSKDIMMELYGKYP